MKKTNFLDVATSRSLKSEVDLFSKFEVNFLQRYMRCILADQFNNLLFNVNQELFYRKLQEKTSKTVGISLFEAKLNFNIQDLVCMLTEYFKQKSPSVNSGVFSQPLKLVYGIEKGKSIQIKEKQFIYIDVKIRVQVARIEEIPSNINMLLKKFGAQIFQNSDKKFQQKLQNSKGQYLNIMIFYYGDIHFNFKRPEYEIKQIKIGNKVHEVRIFGIYVSKTALFQTFRTTNRVNVECINDLVISFYDIKRQKKLIARHKKKQMQQNLSQFSINSLQNAIHSKGFDLRLLLGAGGAICLGIVLFKLFS